MEYFKYGTVETDYLSKKDEVMKSLIEKHGHIHREVNPDTFSALVSSIISQQISTKAAETVKNRIKDQLGEIKPENLCKLSEEEIQGFGLSFRKAGYIKNVAEKAISRAVDFEKLADMSDEEVIKELVELKGVGKWTAEMILIFSLGRMDILSYDDLGIRRGIENSYGIHKLEKKNFLELKSSLSPYGTVASLYLWAESAVK